MWPSLIFFGEVSCSGLLGKEGVVSEQRKVLLNVLKDAALLALTRVAEVRTFLIGCFLLSYSTLDRAGQPSRMSFSGGETKCDFT